MAAGSALGVKLGLAISQIGAKVREDSLGRTTPALVRQAVKVADAEAGHRAELARQKLIAWFESTGVSVPPGGELAGLLGAIGRAGGFMLQQTLSTAIGFGIGGALTAVLSPYFNDMTQAAWRSNPSQLLSPAELAALAARGWIPADRLHDEGQSSGVTAERMDKLRRLADVELAGSDVLELLRRGHLDEAEARRRLERSGVPEDTRELLLALRTQMYSAGEALTADLQGQLMPDEARAKYARAGGDLEEYEWRFNTQGQAPTPTQALELLNRRIIVERGRGPGEISYEQAFLEGPWRNKWLEPFLALREYIVPPRSVVPMVRSGAWDAARGIEELTKSGVPADVAEAMLSEASAGKLEAERSLVKTEVLAAYRDGLLSGSDAEAALTELGYGPEEAALILAIADHAWERSFRDALVRRVRSLYVGRKITEDEAQAALTSIGVPGSAMSKYLGLWDVEREIPTADLTEAQARRAWLQGVVDEAYYSSWLTGHGYSPEEAQILVQTYQPEGA